MQIIKNSETIAVLQKEFSKLQIHALENGETHFLTEDGKISLLTIDGTLDKKGCDELTKYYNILQRIKGLKEELYKEVDVFQVFKFIYNQIDDVDHEMVIFDFFFSCEKKYDSATNFLEAVDKMLCDNEIPVDVYECEEGIVENPYCVLGDEPRGY